MALVVSDTSAIAAFVHLGLDHVLKSLFSQVYIPPAVADELKNPRGVRPVVDVAQFDFIRVRQPSDRARVQRLREELDAGESEAIVLAIELAADWILIDEQAGRRAAIALGLHTTGVCGILVRGKRAGLVQSVYPLVKRLIREIDFRISPTLLAQILTVAGESTGE